ncbi:uncharacterized protein [Eurosta solidaginis]|uniref:uncharacterized protein n=1 Tax=Eurosta solidaginis TaxID=178769 RepID=UPI003531310C
MAGSSNFITFFVLSISVCVKQYMCVYYPVGPCQRMHPVIELADEEILEYGELQNVQHLRYAVGQILISRFVSTDGHTRVGNYVFSSLRQMGWIEVVFILPLLMCKYHCSRYGEIQNESISVLHNENANAKSMKQTSNLFVTAIELLSKRTSSTHSIPSIASPWNIQARNVIDVCTWGKYTKFPTKIGNRQKV